MVTDVNYDLVLNSFDARYSMDLLSGKLHQDLLDIRPPSEEPHDLRRFYHEVNGIHASLQSIHQSLDGNMIIEAVLAKKLPKSVRLDLVRYYGYTPDSYNMTALLAGLLKYCKDAEWSDRTERIFDAPTDEQPTQNSIAVDTSDLSSRQCCQVPELKPAEPVVEDQRVAEAVVSTIADVQLQERRTCPLCGYLHSAADCTVYNNTKQRLRHVQKLKLCILCLREGHPAASCPRRTTHPCKFCGHGQHNRALCMVAVDGRQRTVRHPSRMRATKGSNIVPEASDHQRHSRPSAPAGSNIRTAEPSANRDDTNTVPTATTLRQSGTQSSRGHINGNLMNRKKRIKDLGTAPPGRTGTNRPPTTSTDESMKQNGADVYGSDRILPGRYNLLRTDKCSTNRETLQLGRANTDGPGGAEYQYELYDYEDVSLTPSVSHCSNAASEPPLSSMSEDGFPPNNESTAYVACASDSEEQPAVLHECLAVTAMNPSSKKSRRAVIMFDSGSTHSIVSSKLANVLDLPQHETQVRNVNTFGSKTPAALKGFRTFLVLRSAQGRRLQVNVTVTNCIVSSVRTALVRDTDLPTLRRGDCLPTTAKDALSSPPSKPELPTSRLHLRPSKLAVCQPADNAGGTTASLVERSAYPPSTTHRGTAVYATNGCLEPSTSTTFASKQTSPLLRVSGALPRSTQKQVFKNPLDAKLLLLPTHFTTHVEVEDVSEADNAAETSRTRQEPFSSKEAERRYSFPPLPTQGSLICASLYETGSHLQRKTRLIFRLPEDTRQHLGIYNAREPVLTVTLLYTTDSAFISLLQAERELQLVLVPPLQPQIIINLRTSFVKCFRAPQVHAVLRWNAFVAALRCLLRPSRREPATAGWPQAFGRSGSCHDCLLWLRSLRSPRMYTRQTFKHFSLDHCWPPCTSIPVAHVLSSKAFNFIRVLAFRRPAAEPSSRSCLIPSSLATTVSAMGRRTPKNTSNLQTSLGTVGSADNAGLQVSKTGKKTKKAATTVVPADHTRAEGTPRQATTSKSASRTVKPSSMPSAFRLPSAQGKTYNSASLAAASTTAKPPVMTQPARPRQRPASAQANPASRQCRWASLSQGSAGHSRVASRQCRYSRDRSRGPVPAPPLVRTTEASPKRRPRGPRADLNDQKLFAARPWPPVSNFFSAPRRRATRATQEPLEPLTPAPAHSLSLPPQCAFCGQIHLSRECNVYTTVSQRLNRIRHHQAPSGTAASAALDKTTVRPPACRPPPSAASAVLANTTKHSVALPLLA